MSRFLDWLDRLPGRLWDGLRRLRVVTLAALLVAVVVAVTVISLGSEADGVRAGSEVVSEQGRPLGDLDEPTAYRIVYRVENRAGGDLVMRTDELLVRRPFSARLTERPGQPPGGEPDGVTVTRFGFHAVDGADAEPVALNVPPNPGIRDRPAVESLDVAVSAGLIERRERRRIAAVDAECQVYRMGPSSAGPITRFAPGTPDASEVCIDGRGLVLEQVDFADRTRVLRRLVAVEVEVDLEIGPDVFAGVDATPAPADQGGGSILAVDPASRPPADRFFELDEAPVGFKRRGRFAVIPPQPGAFADPLQSNRRTAGVVDVWTRGADFIAVDQGGTLGRVQAFEPEPDARPVQAGGLGDAELIFGLRTSEVRATLDAGRYVRVYGTVAPELLLSVARDLRAEPGGELVYLDRS